MRHILKRKIKLIGRVFRHNTFIRKIFEEKILEKETRERLRSQKAHEGQIIFMAKNHDK